MLSNKNSHIYLFQNIICRYDIKSAFLSAFANNNHQLGITLGEENVQYHPLKVDLFSPVPTMHITVFRILWTNLQKPYDE